MTDQQTDKRPERPRISWLVGALGWVTGIAFVAVLIGALCILGTASDIGARIGNTEKREGWWAFLLLVACIAWLILWFVVRFLTPVGRLVKWLNRQSSDRAGVLLGFVWMCLLPPLYLWGMNYAFPAKLGTEAGFVRITSSGKLMLPGAVVSANRFERSSKVVPIGASTATVVFEGLSRNGFTTRVTATVEYQPRVGDEFRRLSLRRYADIPFLTSGYSGASKVEYRFLSDEVALLLEPVIDRTLNELDMHPTNGAPSELTIRSRASAEDSLPKLPAWLMYIRVSNISVESWKKE